MECPQCKLINPESAACCDCGYSFLSGKMEIPHVPVVSASKLPDALGAASGRKTPFLAKLGLVLAWGVVAAGCAVLLLSLLLKYWGL